MSKLKGEIQTDNGDILYPHTSSDVVFGSDGKSVTEHVESLEDSKADLVDGKVPSEQLPSMNYLSPTGEGKDVKVTFTESTARANILSGEKLSVLFGKVKKYFTDLKTVAFSGSYTDLSNKPTSLPANGGTSSACSGNSATATKLQTSRTINGVAFDGTKNISISASDSSKAPINHRSSGSAYGLGSTSYYGHCKIRNDLNASSYADGQALSAYQGKILADKLKYHVVTITSSRNWTVPSGVIELDIFAISGGCGGDAGTKSRNASYGNRSGDGGDGGKNGYFHFSKLKVVPGEILVITVGGGGSGGIGSSSTGARGGDSRVVSANNLMFRLDMDDSHSLDGGNGGEGWPSDYTEFQERMIGENGKSVNYSIRSISSTFHSGAGGGGGSPHNGVSGGPGGISSGGGNGGAGGGYAQKGYNGSNATIYGSGGGGGGGGGWQYSNEDGKNEHEGGNGGNGMQGVVYIGYYGF